MPLERSVPLPLQDVLGRCGETMEALSAVGRQKCEILIEGQDPAREFQVDGSR
jgi:hypothetical protein